VFHGAARYQLELLMVCQPSACQDQSKNVERDRLNYQEQHLYLLPVVAAYSLHLPKTRGHVGGVKELQQVLREQNLRDHCSTVGLALELVPSAAR
jgi:hypothetical protein